MLRKKLLLFVPVLLGALFLSGCSFKREAPEVYQVELEVWGVFDDSDAYGEVLNEYKQHNPYLRAVNYRKMSEATYKEDLINALAAGKGPDIFMIRNSWRSAFEDKVAPAPDNLLSERAFREALVDVAAFDFLGADNKIYGVPLSVDSLALYYNKDIFNAAGIAEPPATWEALLAAAEKLNQIDQNGNIVQSAVALGTGKNINRSTDILSAILFQLGSNLAQPISGQLNLADEATPRGLRFYTQFADIGTPSYSWNPLQHYSIDSFYEGKLGMMINYSWQYPVIKQKNAKLNVGIAPLPQFAGTKPQNIANYWGFAVAKNKPYVAPAGQENVVTDLEKQNYLRVHESWQLLKYLAFPHPDKVLTLQNGLSGTTKDFPMASDPGEKYLEKTLKPAARRDLITKQASHPVLGAFATGNLIAKNWEQKNPEAIEGVLAEMIDSVNTGEKTIDQALSAAANRINLIRQ